MMATIRTMPRIPAKTEPTIIGTMFLLVAEFTEAAVGDAVPWELVEVILIESMRLKPERTAVAEPARAVGELAPDGRGDEGSELEVITTVWFEELPSVFGWDVNEGVGVGVTLGPGLEFC